MPDDDWLTERFEANRAHLRAVAYRMLGSASEADDAVQEAWVRLHRSDTSDVENLGGWLTTVTARVCLDMLRSRKSRREDAVGVDVREAVEPHDRGIDPGDAAVLADSVGPALLLVLDTLAPAERLAFVLHDLFAVPFDEIAPMVGRSAAATRQLASRARRRVQGAAVPDADLDVARQRAIVDAFLAAARGGDFDALLELLDPEVVMRADVAAVEMGTQPELVGAHAVAGRFLGGARALSPALVDGAVGLVWAQRGTPRVVFGLTITDGKIAAIEQLADPEVLGVLDLEILRED
jgi:RNA polymerase sigma-70 factor (ECF subfamily)